MKRFVTISIFSAVIAFSVGLSWAYFSPSLKRHIYPDRYLKILCDEAWLPQELLEEYANRNGLHFRYYSYRKPSEFVRQIANAGAEFDVICFHSATTKSLIQAGVLNKIDPRQLANFEQISVDFHNLPFDKDFAYSIPLFWNAYGFVAKAIPKSDLSWRERWQTSAKRIQLWPSELDVYFTMLKTGLEITEWTDENQTRKFAEYLKRFSSATGGWVKASSIQASVRDLSADLDMIQVPSGKAAKLLADNRDLHYWIPEDGVSVSVALLGQGSKSQFTEEGFELINWLIDGAQALRIQKFAQGSVVQPALNNSDELFDLQKTSLIREIPASRLRFTDIELDALPRFEKLFREIESKQGL